jgi:hypothetical protein
MGLGLKFLFELGNNFVFAGHGRLDHFFDMLQLLSVSLTEGPHICLRHISQSADLDAQPPALHLFGLQARTSRAQQGARRFLL